jgi:hypothetical protein
MKTLFVTYAAATAALAIACSSEVPVGSGIGNGQAALGGLGEPPNAGACDTRLTDCANICVALDADPANCGGCGVICAGGTCTGGSCVDSSDAGPESTPDAATVTCPTNFSLCNGGCVNLATDPANCGGCGAGCQASQSCVRATCSPSTPDVDGGNPTPEAGAASDASPPASDGGVTYKLTVTYNGYDQFFGQDESIWLQDITTSPNGSNVGSLACGGGSFSANQMDVYTGLVAGHTYAYDYWLDNSSSGFCFGYPVPPYYAQTFGPVTGDTSIVATPSDPLTSH